ncbi:MAG TPA: hypothetical protein PLF28_01830 [Agitococcus sp.]|nr:hypothetical protein [Agitococcus sp.]HNN28906.1 hypothetical protein [Agitococcus sp.]
MTRLKFLALSISLFTAACSPHRLIGNQINHFSQENVLPVVMASDDITMVCHANETNTPLLMSFNKFGVDSSLLLALGYSGSATCIDIEAHEKQIWSALAEKQGLVNMAQDARIAQQLLNRDAGKRQILAYQNMASYFKQNYQYEIGEGQCPTIKEDREQLLLIVGATAALQALKNDVASGRLINFDMSIPAKVGRAMSCVDNEKWWGEPQAIQAGLKVILPKDAAEEQQAWQKLQDATDIGLQTGVRLAHATYAAIASIKGRDDYLRDALKRFEALPEATLNTQYKLLNQIAALQVRQVANMYWVKNEGRRAPTENFSQFWDEKAKPSATVNQLLDEL